MKTESVAPAAYAASVFINCPFDLGYRPMLWAAIFAILDCGYQPRSAQEVDDGGEVRIDKILRIIEECKFGVHDISQTDLDHGTNLPRFNMPYELGIFLGARHFGSGEQPKKTTLILDREPYRYQIFLSDIAGQDIKAHSGDPEELITKVRNWLSSATNRSTIPGATLMKTRFREFLDTLPALCAAVDLSEDELLFNEYTTLASSWLRRATGQVA